MEYLKKLFTVLVFSCVFIGFPMLIGSWGHLAWSWIPAIVLINYLDD